MRSRAAWRSRPDDPRTFVGWALREWRSPLLSLGTGLAWLLRIWGLLLLLHGNPVGVVVAWFVSTIPETVAESVTSAFRSPSARRSLEVAPLLTLPPLATPFPCEIEVLRNGTLLGHDVGIVTFLDGWLHYEGLRTSFSLRRGDVAHRRVKTLELAEGGELGFAPRDRLAAGGLDERDLARRFYANLKSWMRSDSPAGRPTLPPTAAHPSGLARGWLKLGTSALVFAGAVAIALAPVHPTGPIIVLTLPFLWDGFCGARDLRRLERRSKDAQPLLPPNESRRPIGP